MEIINTTHDHRFGIHREDMVDKHNKDCREFANLMNKNFKNQRYLFVVENACFTKRGDGFFRTMLKGKEIQYDIQSNRDNCIKNGAVIYHPSQLCDKVENIYKGIDLCVQLTENRIWALVFFHNDLDKSKQIPMPFPSTKVENRYEDIYLLKDPVKRCRLFNLKDEKELRLLKLALTYAMITGNYDYTCFEKAESKMHFDSRIFYNRIRLKKY